MSTEKETEERAVSCVLFAERARTKARQRMAIRTSRGVILSVVFGSLREHRVLIISAAWAMMLSLKRKMAAQLGFADVGRQTPSSAGVLSSPCCPLNCWRCWTSRADARKAGAPEPLERRARAWETVTASNSKDSSLKSRAGRPSDIKRKIVATPPMSAIAWCR